MLIWLIMTLLRFFILNFFNVSLKLSSKDWQVIETHPFTFLDRLWGISWSLRIAVVFEHSDATSEKRVKGCAGSGIKLLMSEHPLTIQNLLIKFKKFLANWIVPEIFKWSPFLPWGWLELLDAKELPFSTMKLIRVTGCERKGISLVKVGTFFQTAFI